MPTTIELTKGKFATVDDADYEHLSQWEWFYHSQGYAVRNARKGELGQRSIVYMHRYIVGAAAGMDVDHQDRDKLNNQRYNLREATQAQNQHNRAPRAGRAIPYKGVRFDPVRNRYRARITVNRREMQLGRFMTMEDAARAYDTAARHYFGVFARTNFEVSS
jgi:hypothetical protein